MKKKIIVNKLIRNKKVTIVNKLRKVVIVLKKGKILPLIMFKGKNKHKILFVLFSILTIIFIGKSYSLNFLSYAVDGILNPSPIVFKYILMVFSIINFILILRYIIFIVSIYLISKGKLSKSIFKPFFLNNFIDRLKNLVSEDRLDFVIDYYYKHMYIYIVLFIFTMLLYIVM